MKSISYDLNGGILTHNLQSNEMIYTVTLLSSQDYEDDLFDLIDLYDEGITFNVEIERDHANQSLTMNYQVEPGFLPLNIIENRLSLEQKLDISLQLIEISRFFEKNNKFILVLSPINILFHEKKNQVRLLYAGIQGLMPVVKEFEGLVIEQIKNFLESFLRYKEKVFKSLPLQEQMANIHLRQGVREAKTFVELESVLRKEQEELPVRLERLIQLKKQEEQQSNEEKNAKAQKNQRSIKNSISKTDLIQIVNNYHKKRFRYYFILGITAIVIGLFSFYLFQEYLFSSSNTTTQEDENLKKGKELAAMQRFEEAVTYFNKVNFNNLSEEDTQIVLASYLSAKQPQKIIDLAPAFTKDIVNFYIKINDLEAIKKLKPNHPIIQFEQAVINKDKKKIISLKDKVPLDDRRKYVIAFAYMTENDFKEALNFAKEHKQPDLEEILSHIQKNDYASAYEHAKKQDSKFLMQIVKEKEADYIQKSNLPDDEKSRRIGAILKEIEDLKKQSSSNEKKSSGD